ncbi:MAG TPA: hypothetical protein VMB74_19370, partial [Streptosporangiaceae bacterium]|nr:hypothetical protein [Streptosporangiaceae bacterium]
MTALEDRLTQELRQLAEVAQPETIRPLGGPAGRSRAAVPGRLYLAWTRRSRLFAPVVATVAVVAVAVGLGVVAPWLSQPGGGTRPTASALARSNAIPPYYATVTGPSDHGLKTFVAVYDSATGARVARVSLPTVYFKDGHISALSLPDITAARNGRTFVLLSAPFPFPDNREGSFGYATRMFRLQVSDSGAVHVTQLPFHVPSDAYISSPEDIDLSPDGTRLAIASDWDCGKTRCARTGIQVLNLTTGAVTGSWSTLGGIGEVDNLSWVNSTSLAFEWVPLTQRGDRIIYQPVTRGSRPYRVLALSAAPVTDLLAASEPVASPDAQQPDFNTVPTVLVTPDGQTVVTSQVTLSSHGHEAEGRIVELDAHTGQRERTLYTASATGDASELEAGCNVLSLG